MPSTALPPHPDCPWAGPDLPTSLDLGFLICHTGTVTLPAWFTGLLEVCRGFSRHGRLAPLQPARPDLGPGAGSALHRGAFWEGQAAVSELTAAGPEPTPGPALR